MIMKMKMMMIMTIAINIIIQTTWKTKKFNKVIEENMVYCFDPF